MRPVFASSRTMAFAMRSSASSENMRSISLRKGRERGCERGARIEEGGGTAAGIAAVSAFWRCAATILAGIGGLASRIGGSGDGRGRGLYGRSGSGYVAAWGVGLSDVRRFTSSEFSVA